MDQSLSTDVPEIMTQVLLFLNYKDLMNTCRTNKALYKLCQDDYFWKLKVEYCCGMFTEDKPPNITYHQQYIDLITIDNPFDAMWKNRLDVLKLLAHNKIFPHQSAVNWAAQYSSLEIIKCIAQTTGLYPDQNGVNWAASHGRLDVLEWSAKTQKIYPDMIGASNASMCGYPEVLKWLAQNNISNI